MTKLCAALSLTIITYLSGAARAQTQASEAPLPPTPPPAAASPPVFSPSDFSLMARGHQLREEIAGLQRKRSEYSLGAPIAMMVGGGGVALAAVLVYSATNVLPNVCGHSCEDDHGGNDGDDGVKSTMVIIGVIGLVYGGFGFVRLQSLLGPRRQLAEQIRSKRAELHTIESRIQLAPLVGPLSLRGLTVGLSF